MPLKKILLSSLIIVLCIFTIEDGPRNFIFEGHIFKVIDNKATIYVNSGLKRATTAFAIARTFNAIVSVFRESDLQIEPGGIGVSVAAGAALDPINDLVERFSWVMLASMTSLGIQNVLIQITPFLSIQIILMLALLSFLVGLWLSKPSPINFIRIGRVLIVVAILLRLAVPTMAFLNNQVYVTFLGKTQDDSVKALQKTVGRLKEQDLSESTTQTAQAEEDNKEGGWIESVQKFAHSVKDQAKKIADVKAKVEIIENAASGLIKHIVDLIVVFVLNTIILPLLFLWGMLKFGRLLVSRGFAEPIEDWFSSKINLKQ
ncbi:hypothetical protein [Malonomonas rubra]|uniref:hypothetical protein n=1 Tax=Malonomonas rubra TaxID=57040 RepID=UPI0026ECEFD3|nr:hypothetical protein [Malonomonas rubra]